MLCVIWHRLYDICNIVYGMWCMLDVVCCMSYVLCCAVCCMLHVIGYILYVVWIMFNNVVRRNEILWTTEKIIWKINAIITLILELLL
jgi:hypothetical protein